MKKPHWLKLLITLIFVGTSFVIGSAFSFYTKHSAMNTNPAAGKIIYVYDALCGWCYGFSPVIDKLYENYSNQLEFEVVSGGMVTGERIGPVSDMANYISRAYIDVENASGVKFGKAFIDTTLYRDDVVFSSVEPALALSAFKTMQPRNAVKFASAIQKAIYYHGAEPALSATYADLAQDFGINRAEFLDRMNDPQTLALAEADFQRSKTLGVNGFPTTFYEDADGSLFQLSRGFTSYEKILARLKPLLEVE
jgi:putative protein-disulfide isomerase